MNLNHIYLNIKLIVGKQEGCKMATHRKDFFFFVRGGLSSPYKIKDFLLGIIVHAFNPSRRQKQMHLLWVFIL